MYLPVYVFDLSTNISPIVGCHEYQLRSFLSIQNNDDISRAEHAEVKNKMHLYGEQAG